MFYKTLKMNNLLGEFKPNFLGEFPCCCANRKLIMFLFQTQRRIHSWCAKGNIPQENTNSSNLQCFFYRTGTVTCNACPAGSFSASEGSTQCSQCRAGTISASPGSAACAPCPAGTYSVSAGATTCRACATGTYSGAEGATSCTSCAAGQRPNAQTQATGCEDCPADTYSTTGGACESCPTDRPRTMGPRQTSISACEGEVRLRLIHLCPVPNPRDKYHIQLGTQTQCPFVQSLQASVQFHRPL